ncbi:MAG: capsid protein VP2 [bacterium]
MQNKRWIQRAVNPKHEGRVRAYVRRIYGSKAFNKNGTIKQEYFTKAKEHAKKNKETGLVRAIVLAQRLGHYVHRR